jgi:23S rRNA pseudouridine2605 synthase
MGFSTKDRTHKQEPLMKRKNDLRRVGVARALSKLGFCSRAVGFELALSGRVRVNGAVRRDPESPVHLEKDRIEVDGKIVEKNQHVYLVMNKRRGVVTTASDEKGRETVYEYLEISMPWVAPVGRLDKMSEGLLLLTNDSEWAGKITNPDTHLDKIYHVQIAKVTDEELLKAMTFGIKTPEGTLRAKRAAFLRSGDKNSWIEVVLDEGKNRQIRRIFESLAVEVLRLVRVQIGPLALGNLGKGQVRQLTAEEKRSIDRAMEAGHILGI